MNFLLENVDHTNILRLKEERLDSTVAPDLKAQLLMLINNDTNKNIIVNLSKVYYADSSGLGSLLFGLRQAREEGIHFAICGAQKRVLNLIQIAHLDNVLINYKDEYEAIEQMKK
jgi:anti-anti-sigma factor